MKNINNQIIKLMAITLSCVSFAACEGDFKNDVNDISSYSSGDADFTKFVAIGDSLTAGYADSALYLNGQENSYPAILATQFAKVGGGTFTQPLVSDNLGGLLFSGNPSADPDNLFANRLVLNGATSSPEPIAGTQTTEVFSLQTGDFNNVGVPGAKSFHLTLGNYGDPAVFPASSNPYYIRFAPSTTTSVIAAAASQTSSFFTMWIGNNDVLSYATSGGVETTGYVLGSPVYPPYGTASDDITDPTVFQATYDALVGAMTADPNAKGVLINIPDVSTIPYFTTVPFNAVPLDQATADALMAGGFDAYNGGVTASIGVNGMTAEEAAARQITFVAGQNAVLILDDDLKDLTGVSAALLKMRQATAEDLLVLTASSKIGTENTGPTDLWGVSSPLEDGDVLIPSEIQAIETARLAFNATIKAAADADDNLIFFDAAALLAEIDVDGVNYGTGYVDSTYATGGAFSLDGVHPTARGYAIVANEIIKVINTDFNAEVPAVDPAAYTTIFIK